MIDRDCTSSGLSAAHITPAINKHAFSLYFDGAFYARQTGKSVA